MPLLTKIQFYPNSYFYDTYFKKWSHFMGDFFEISIGEGLQVVS